MWVHSVGLSGASHGSQAAPGLLCNNWSLPMWKTTLMMAQLKKECKIQQTQLHEFLNSFTWPSNSSSHSSTGRNIFRKKQQDVISCSTSERLGAYTVIRAFLAVNLASLSKITLEVQSYLALAQVLDALLERALVHCSLLCSPHSVWRHVNAAGRNLFVDQAFLNVAEIAHHIPISLHKYIVPVWSPQFHTHHGNFISFGKKHNFTDFLSSIQAQENKIPCCAQASNAVVCFPRTTGFTKPTCETGSRCDGPGFDIAFQCAKMRNKRACQIQGQVERSYCWWRKRKRPEWCLYCYVSSMREDGPWGDNFRWKGQFEWLTLESKDGAYYLGCSQCMKKAAK